MPISTRRSRVPRAKLQPTVAVGQPMPSMAPSLRINEPATLVGDVSGKPLVRVGDNPHGPETLQVTPPAGRAVIGQPQPDGAISASGGATLSVGYDPLEEQRKRESAVLDAKDAQLGSATASLGAQANVYQAQAGTYQPQQQQIDARRNVLGAEAAQTAGQRAYIGSQMGANTQRIAEEVGIQNARANVADTTAVGRALQYRETMDQYHDLAGVARMREVETANGADANLGPGVRAKLQTQGELLTSQRDNAETLRKLNLASQALGVDLLGLTVDDLKRVATEAGLNVDQAQLAVERARNAAGIAGLGEKAAGLNVDRANIAADREKLNVPPGMRVWSDPVTGESRVLTQAQYDGVSAQYKRALNISQAAADQDTKYQVEQILNGQSPLAGFSEAEMLSKVGFVGPGSPYGPLQVKAELMRRGYTAAQADEKVQRAIDDYTRNPNNLPGDVNSGGSGGTKITGAPPLNVP